MEVVAKTIESSSLPSTDRYIRESNLVKGASSGCTFFYINLRHNLNTTSHGCWLFLLYSLQYLLPVQIADESYHSHLSQYLRL